MILGAMPTVGHQKLGFFQLVSAFQVVGLTEDQIFVAGMDRLSDCRGISNQVVSTF